MIIAATGHRPDKLGGYGAHVQAKLFKLARTYLESSGATHVISGMALGWDTAIARAALDLNLKLIAAVPFAGQASRWPQSDRATYLRLLRAAHVVHYVSEPGYDAAKMHKRNEWMVDTAQGLVALWNGSSGGTANCIRYARRKGLEPVNLWEQWVRLP